MERIGLSKNNLVDKSTNHCGLESFLTGLVEGAAINPGKAVVQIAEQMREFTADDRVHGKSIFNAVPISIKSSGSNHKSESNPRSDSNHNSDSNPKPGANSEANLSDQLDSILKSKSIHEIAQNQNSAHELGTVLGSFLPYAAVSLLTRRMSDKFFGAVEIPTLKRIVVEHSSTGFVIGSLLTPSERPEADFARTRLSQGVKSALVFASMGATAHGMAKALPIEGKLFSAGLARNLTVASTAGAAGGVVDAELSTHFRAAPEELLTHASSYAAFGTAMELGVAHFSRATLPAKLNERARRNPRSNSFEHEYAQILAELDGSTISMASNANQGVEAVVKSRLENHIEASPLEKISSQVREEVAPTKPCLEDMRDNESNERAHMAQVSSALPEKNYLSEKSDLAEKSEPKKNANLAGKTLVGEACEKAQQSSPQIVKPASEGLLKKEAVKRSDSGKQPTQGESKNNPSALIKRHLFELEKIVKERLLSDEEMKRYRENVMLELKQLNYVEGKRKGFNIHSVFMNLPGMSDAQKVRLADVVTLVNKCTVDGGLSEQSWSRAKSALAEELNFARTNSAFQSGAEEKILQRVFAQLKTSHNEGLKSPAVDFETIAYANQIMRKVGYTQADIQALDAKMSIARCNPCKDNLVSTRPGIENYANYIDVESKKTSDYLESNELRKTKLRDAADYYLEKEKFDRNLDDKFVSGKRLARLSFLEEKFERSGHSDKEKARFYWELNRILDFEQSSPFSLRERRDLMEQVLNHASFPTTVKQGANNTCNVATCESRIYSRTPHQMARLIADLVENGTFRTRSGRVLDITDSLSGIRPDAEARECIQLQNKMDFQKYDIKVDKNRDWASQLVQLTLVKIKHVEGIKLFDAKKMTEFDEDNLLYDSDGKVQGMVLSADDVLPLVKSNGKPNEEPSRGQKHFIKSGPFIQEVDPANLVYDKYSEIIGCLEKSNKMLRLFDKGGNSVRDFDKSATNFFGPDGNLLLFQNRAGTLTYDKLITRSSFRYTPKQFELERLHVTHLGNRLFVHELNRFGVYRMVSGPEIAAANLLNICNQVTGTEDKSFVLCRVDGEPFISRRQLEVVNVDQLHEALCKLQDTQQFPAIVRVDTRNAPWNQEHGGGHVLNIRAYSPEQKLVRLTNQWDTRSNEMLQKMPLESLLEAMRLRVDLDKKSPH